VSDPLTTLARACQQVGLDSTDAELIRAGENTLYRLPAAVVARVTRAGGLETACKETRVSRWLQRASIPVVETAPDVSQPADLELPPLAPFVRLDQRIAAAAVLSTDDRAWLATHLERLQEQYERLSPGLPQSAVHGDALGGNIVATATGPVVLDLERFAYGHPEWDLASIAVDRFTFGTTTAAQWTQFCARYGHDVTEWVGYSVLRDARELRKVTFAAQMADQYPHLAEQAQYRLACIRGEHGPLPWRWMPVP